MELGFALPVCGPWATGDNQLVIAAQAERLGYASLWTFQRLLFPVRPAEPYAGGRDGDRWPAYFQQVQDPLISLAHVAGRTSRIRLGIAVLNAPFFNPLLLGKQLASLDALSGGRLTIGFGVGWSHDEYAAAGVPYRQRGRRADELIRCLHAIWADDPVEWRGEFFTVPESFVGPKPAQKPHPPLLIGGVSERALRRAATLGDGWISANAANLTRIDSSIQAVRRIAAEAGRDPAELRFVSRGTVLLRADVPDDEDRRPLHGSLAQVKDDLDRYAELGVGEVFLELNFDEELAAPGADPERALDRAVTLLDAFARIKG